jgi:DNA-binding transcriptional ArsR family regulator
MFDSTSLLARDSCDLSWALARIEARIEEIEGEITRSDVFEYLTRSPGAGAGEIADGLGVGQGAVSAHLYRGKGQLFSSRAGRWYPVPSADSSARRW